MAVQIFCPSCWAESTISRELARQGRRCRECGGYIPELRRRRSAPINDSAANDPSAPLPTTHDDAGPPPPRGHQYGEEGSETDWDDDSDTRGGPGARRGKKSNLPIILGIGGFVLLVSCGVGSFGLYWALSEEEGPQRGPVPMPMPMNPPVRQSNLTRLRINMTRADVEAILGPAEVLSVEALPTAFPWADQVQSRLWAEKAAVGRVVAWRDGSDHIVICFSPTGGAEGRAQAFTWEQDIGRPLAVGWLDDRQYLTEFGPGKPGAGRAVEMTVQALTRAFEENPIAGDILYRDRLVVIDGTLSGITVTADDVEGQLVGSLPLPNTAPTSYVGCRVSSNERKRLWSLSHGQTVKMKGEVMGSMVAPGRSAVLMANCQIVSVGPDPSISVTAGALSAEFAENVSQADRKYREKELTIRDAVVESRDGVTLILMDSAKKEVAVKIQATLVDGTQRPFGPLEPGTPVKLKGTYASTSDQMIQVERCWIVP